MRHLATYEQKDNDRLYKVMSKQDFENYQFNHYYEGMTQNEIERLRAEFPEIEESFRPKFGRPTLWFHRLTNGIQPRIIDGIKHTSNEYRSNWDKDCHTIHIVVRTNKPGRPTRTITLTKKSDFYWLLETHTDFERSGEEQYFLCDELDGVIQVLKEIL